MIDLESTFQSNDSGENIGLGVGDSCNWRLKKKTHIESLQGIDKKKNLEDAF